MSNHWLKVLFVALGIALCNGSQLESINNISTLVQIIKFKSPDTFDQEVFYMGKSFTKLTNGNFLIEISPTKVGLFNSQGEFIKFITPYGSEENFPAVFCVSSFPTGFIVSDGLVAKKAYIYNLKGKLVKTVLFPILTMHVISVEKYKNYLFLGGFGYEFDLLTKEVNRTILFSRLNYFDYSIDILLSRSKKESRFIVDELDASSVDNFYFSINNNTGKIAGLCPLTPYVWIFDANSGKILRMYKFIPKYYMQIIPKVPYGDDYDAWLSNWTYSNVPFWLNNETVLVSRGYKNTYFIDSYNINDVRDTAKSYMTNSKFPVIYAENNLIYLISNIDGNSITIEIRKIRK